MSKGKELVKNTGILFLGKISTQFVSFLLLPLYTAKLSTDEYGTLDLYTTIACILIPILTLQLEQGVFRYLLTNEEDERSVLSSTLCFLMISSLFLTVLYLPITFFVSIEYSGMVLLYYLTMLFSVVAQQIPRGYGNYTEYTIVSFLSSTVSIVFSILFIGVFNGGIEGILTANIISAVVVVFFVCWKSKLFSKLGIRYCSIKCMKSMLKYSMPLVFNQLASWVVNYSDRIVIIVVLGIATNGIYAIANKFFSLIASMLYIFNIAWTESVTKSLSDCDRNKYYNKVFSFTTALFCLAASGITAGIGILFKYFVNVSYDAAYYQIPILVYAAMFSGLSANVGSIYIAYKKTKEISLTTIVTAVINVLVHIGLIKFIGLYAASISTLVSFAAMFFYRIFRLKNVEPLKFNLKLLLMQLPFIVAILISYYLRNVAFQITALLLLCAYGIYFLLSEEVIRGQIGNMLKNFKKLYR